ncbi:MAG: helix-turn-helix transcriptional regulator [Ruminococcaceae bacterium]|nr:helix-turn-helix transcriptional regulator [Oscillospiraceae bacterium]
MTLGEKIYKLRNERNLSQGDLADALEVSRQSISKWETDASVPELDKLVKMSVFFSVSLDELILDKTHDRQPEFSKPKIICTERLGVSSTQKTVGIVLLCISAALWLLIALLGDILSGLILAAPFVACGIICLRVQRNAGLWCAWVIYLFIEIYLLFTTGIGWHYAFIPLIYSSSEMTTHLIVAWCLLAVYATLTVITALRIKKAHPVVLRKELIGAGACWSAVLITRAISRVVAREAANAVVFPRYFIYFNAVFGWVRNIILTVAFIFTYRLIIALIKKRQNT